MAKERVVSRNSSRPLLQRAKGRSLLDPARRSMATATAGKKRKRSMKAKATVKADSFSEDSDIDDIQQDDIDPSKPRRSSRLEKKQTAVETKATTDAIYEESSDDNDLKSDNEDTAEEDNGDSDADEDTEDDSYTAEVDSEVDETYQEEGREKDGEYAVPSLDHTRHAEEVENVAVEASSPFGENSPLSYSPNTHGRHKRRKLRRPASSTSSSIPASDAAELGIIEEDETFAIAFMDSPSRNATPITIGTSKGLRSDSPKSRLTTHNKKSSSLAEKLALRLEQESSELDLSKHVVVPEIRFDRQDSKEQEDENIHDNESGDDVDGEEMIIDFYNESSERKLVHGEDLHPEMQLDPVNVEDLDIHPAPTLIEKESSSIDQTEPTKDQDNTHENQGDGTQNRGFWSLLFGRKSSASDEENTREQGDPESSNESEEPSFWSRLLPYGPHYDL